MRNWPEQRDPHMGTRKPRVRDVPKMGHLNAVLPTEVLAKITEAQAKASREGVSVSRSSFAEIAVTELLGRHDMVDILRKRGASAKRA